MIPDDSSSAPAGQPPSDLASLEAKIREWAKPKPMYTQDCVRATHALRYDWTGWLSDGKPFPPTTTDAIRGTTALWQDDGLTLGEFRILGDRAQILFETTPQVAPALFAARVKGRLQHALRHAGTPVKFSRKVSFRSLGENIRAVVEAYLGRQVKKEKFADPRFEKRMQKYTVVRDTADLAQPTTTISGRYWYNLHLVLVASGRRRTVDYGTLASIRDAAIRVMDGKGCRFKSLSVMPDHLHVAFRGDIAKSPEEIALSTMNNLSYLLGRNRIWAGKYYVGTFSEYDLDTVRQLADRQTRPPAALVSSPTGRHAPCRLGQLADR